MEVTEVIIQIEPAFKEVENNFDNRIWPPTRNKFEQYKIRP